MSLPPGPLATPGVLYAHQADQEAQASAKVAGLPVEDSRTHDGEMLAAHQGAPSVAIQSQTHGAPLPAADHGYPSDAVKYA